MSGNIVNTTDDNFDADVLQSDIPVIVDFWAGWRVWFLRQIKHALLSQFLFQLFKRQI